jgi:phosphatidylserine decarboxylase
MTKERSMLGEAEEETLVEKADDDTGDRQRAEPQQDRHRHHRHRGLTFAGGLIDRVFQQEDINFLLTNKIPRRLLTGLVGRISGSEQPLVRGISMFLWTLFAGDLDLHEARKSHFTSVHDCFTRELKADARPIDCRPGVIVSPCDAIVGASGSLEGIALIQAKGMGYTADDLLGDRELADRYRNGTYATLRLTSSMYHRFHAPDDCAVNAVRYISGDTWNVNPIALKRVARLFCKNERAVIPIALDRSSESITLVAVGAILVASIRLNFLPAPLNLRYRGPNHISCTASFRRGDEMGFFEHGSTIVVLSTPGLSPAPGVVEGRRIRMGEPLLEYARPATAGRRA